MPAFANATNAVYAAAWWARFKAREEAIEAAKWLAIARGASASTAERAANVAWRINDPAGWHAAKAFKKRKKAWDVAYFEVVGAARAVVFTAVKKAEKAAVQAAQAALLKDALKAAHLAARARAFADAAQDKEDKIFALGYKNEYISRHVRYARNAARRAAQAAQEAAKV